MVQQRLGTTWRSGGAWHLAPWVCLPLAWLALWTDFAAAGCGDYVIFRPHADAANLAAKQVPARGGDQILPAKAPCNTPLCRGSKPAEPAPTPPTPQQIDQRPLALLAGAAEVACPFLSGGGWPRVNETPRDGFGLSLLRPPCA